MQILTDLAATYNIAVDIPHHVSKGAADPGNANRGRGASAAKDAARLVYSLTAMNPEEAKGFDIPDDQRRLYVRMDRAKVNLVPSSAAKWFKLIGEPLKNGTDLYPSGDNVQTVEPWQPSDAWEGLSSAILNTILDQIEAGPRDEDGRPTGERYSNAPAATTRAVWPVVQRVAPNKCEAHCRRIIHAWLDSGLLVSKPYHSPKDRRDVPGLYVDAAKRPGTKVEI